MPLAKVVDVRELEIFLRIRSIKIVATRSQLKNLSKEEMIKEPIAANDISPKLKNSITCRQNFVRRFEALSWELAVRKSCIKLLKERVIQLETNVIMKAQQQSPTIN